jgi:hypothetical protein
MSVTTTSKDFGKKKLPEPLEEDSHVGGGPPVFIARQVFPF